MEKLLACLVVMAMALVSLGITSVAEDSDNQSAYQIFDTKAGVIRMNVKTGEAVLLEVNTGEARWNVIHEPDAQTNKQVSLLTGDVDWVELLDADGKVIGVKLAGFKKTGEYGGLLKNDVILQIDSKPIKSVGDIYRAVAAAKRSDGEVTFSITRNGKEEEIASKFPTGEAPE
ncbi:MAG: PDZ domain-containing protein [Planctomycetes bacterium]|nr:PDZ domain-containing protein [Planctomycetota bacterium]MCA8936296.1 PDZ domain-containing protein [Planctomycetota bacterium]MCA8946482.1 PDZ domain-containing protein [Planctomycetota bacterium]